MAGSHQRAFGQKNMPTPRARIDEIGNAVRVWTESKKSGGPVSVGALLSDGDEVTVEGVAKIAWLDGGMISFQDASGGALFDIGQPAGKEAPPIRSAPIFVRQLAGVIHFVIPPRSVDRKFEIATYTAAVSTNGAKFAIACNARTSATTVRVEEGEVDLVPTNSQLKPINIRANQEVEVNDVAVVYNRNSALRVGGAGNSNSQGSAQDPYFIFVLKLYNYEALYIGTEESLRDRTRCSFGGGGHCLPEDRVMYQKLLGPFDSVGDARKALCQNISERKASPDAAVKGNWGASGIWYGLMDESVSFDCPKAPVVRASVKAVLFFGAVLVLAIGFVFYRMAIRRQ